MGKWVFDSFIVHATSTTYLLIFFPLLVWSSVLYAFHLIKCSVHLLVIYVTMAKWVFLRNSQFFHNWFSLCGLLGLSGFPILSLIDHIYTGWVFEKSEGVVLCFSLKLSSMGKLKIGRMLDCLCLSCSSSTCFCMNGLEGEDSMERKAIIGSDGVEKMRIKDIIGSTGNQTLAYQLKPKMVVLRVSMHCNGCARKVEKHISKMDGVTSFEVDLESKKVIVIGDILPFGVLESVTKVKNAELWTSPIDEETTQHYPVDLIVRST